MENQAVKLNGILTKESLERIQRYKVKSNVLTLANQNFKILLKSEIKKETDFAECPNASSSSACYCHIEGESCYAAAYCLRNGERQRGANYGSDG